MISAVRPLWWSFAAVRKASCVCFAALQKSTAAVQRRLAVLPSPHNLAKWYSLHCKVTHYNNKKRHDALSRYERRRSSSKASTIFCGIGNTSSR